MTIGRIAHRQGAVALAAAALMTLGLQAAPAQATSADRRR